MLLLLNHGKMSISLIFCLALCVQITLNYPTNNDNRDYLNVQDEETESSETKEDEKKKELTTTVAPSTTLVSSIRSTKQKWDDENKQPSPKSMPTATPAKPMEHASNSPTPLHIKPVAPIKSMNDNPLRIAGDNPNSVCDNSSDDGGCLAICHNTEIHPMPEVKVPNEEVRKVLPSLPDMIAPLKDKEPGSCCVWKCGKCNVTICKTSKPTIPPDPGCDEKDGNCAESAPKASNNDGYAESGSQINNNKCVSPICQERNNKCPDSSKPPYSIQIVQDLEKCPFTCSTPALTTSTNDCPLTMACPLEGTSYFPPVITKCNNNYLGKNLDSGGISRSDDENDNADAHTVRQPTTRKISTSLPLSGMRQFTANARADAGSYNPIQAMPTQPVIGADDIIIHNIFMAEPYTTQSSPVDGTVG